MNLENDALDASTKQNPIKKSNNSHKYKIMRYKVHYSFFKTKLNHLKITVCTISYLKRHQKFLFNTNYIKYSMTNQKYLNFGLKSLIILIVLFLSICSVSAHQPRLEAGTNSSMDNPIVIQNPEISQAFYGNLNGQPDYYKITSDKPFKLYVNILVPQSPGINGDFVSAQITDSSGRTIALLDGKKSGWMPMFEEFGGDYYLQGPEFSQNVSAGTYYIKVFNAGNTGKYSMAVGDIESFPADESLKAIITIPLLKEQIFGKPVTTLFFEFLGIILALGSIMVLFAMLIMSKKSEEITQLTIKVNSAVKPVLWLGILITAVVWIYVMFKDPLNIVGIINTILLVILIVLSWYIGSKIAKMKFGKLPLIRTAVLAILWLIFVYWAIAVI